MKRSRTLTLTLMAATGLTLSACGDDLPPPSEMTSFATVQECVAAGFLAEACQEQADKAKDAYLKEAPKFNSLEACQAEYGDKACAPYSQAAGNGNDGGGGFFVPALTGFLIGQALNDIRDDAAYRRYRDRYPEYYGSGSGGYYGLPQGRTGSYSVGQRSFPTLPSTRSGLNSSTSLSTRGGSSPGASSAPAGRRFEVAPGSRPSANVRSATVSRSGFGGTAAARGGGFSG